MKILHNFIILYFIKLYTSPPPNHIHKYGVIPDRSSKSPGLRHSFARQSSQTGIHAMYTLTDRDIRVLKSRYPKK